MDECITELMINNHNRLGELFNEFKSVKHKDKKKTRELFNRFKEELITHFITEEKVIKSVLGKKREKLFCNVLPVASSLNIEHRKILVHLEKISDSIKNEEKIDTSEFHLMLKRHKHIEERLLYPELDRLLGEKERCYILDKIGKGGKNGKNK